MLSLRNTWGLTEDAMPVIRLWAELYPSSNGAQRMLAEGHIDLREYLAAIEVYSRLLERKPDNSRIRSRLEWLRRQ